MTPALADRYKALRRRAPASLDFDTLVERLRTENDRIVEAWRQSRPGVNAAVVEITIPASGHTRRRLRRYPAFAGAFGPPGTLMFRQATTLDGFLELRLVEIAAAAARAEVFDITWRLMEPGEALA